MHNKIFNLALKKIHKTNEDLKKCKESCAKEIKADRSKNFKGIISELESGDRDNYIKWTFSQYLYLQETGALLLEDEDILSEKREEVSTSDHIETAETLLKYLSNRAAHYFYEDIVSWRNNQATIPSEKTKNSSSESTINDAADSLLLMKVKDEPWKLQHSNAVPHTLSYDNTYLYKVLHFIKQKIDGSHPVSQHDMDETTRKHWKIANEKERKEAIIDEITRNTILKARELFIENYDNKPCLKCNICNKKTVSDKSIDIRSVIICEKNISIWRAIAASQKLKYFFRVVGKTFVSKNNRNKDYMLQCEKYFQEQSNIFFQHIKNTNLEKGENVSSFSKIISRCTQDMKTKIDATQPLLFKKDNNGNIWHEKFAFDCFIKILNHFINNILNGDDANSIYRALGTYASQKGIKRAYGERKKNDFLGYELVAIYGLSRHTDTVLRKRNKFHDWFDTYIDLGDDKIDIMLKNITKNILAAQDTSNNPSSPKP